MWSLAQIRQWDLGDRLIYKSDSGPLIVLGCYRQNTKSNREKMTQWINSLAHIIDNSGGIELQPVWVRIAGETIEGNIKWSECESKEKGSICGTKILFRKGEV
jgi:hypothetical protein